MTQRGDIEFLLSRPPYDGLSPQGAGQLLQTAVRTAVPAGQAIYAPGEPLDGLFVILAGEVEILSAEGEALSLLGPGDAFGERGLLRDGRAVTRAVARAATELAVIPTGTFRDLVAREPAFARFFAGPAAARRQPAPDSAADLSLARIADIMTPDPVALPPETAAAEAARVMARHGISSVLVIEDGRLEGIVTTADLATRVLGAGRPGETPLAEVMTRAPQTIGPDAIGHDVLLSMVGRNVTHLPVVDGGRAVGIVTRTNLLQRQSLSAGLLVAEIAAAERAEDLPPIVARIPRLLAQLVSAGGRPELVSRLVTDIADAATRRLLALAEAELGPAPRPWLWLACGSQGRQEQTGVSDQDNCLILSDAATAADDAYFAALARRVSDGLHACGYFYCPGDMMATNPRWRQPVRVWRDYFAGWIRTPNPMAQMLASVMFDLRPIAGDETLFRGLQAETLEAARANSIFLAHMTANALKHAPPLSLFGGLALIRSGEHKNTLDLKHSGVVPVVDLGRMYAILGAFAPANTRARLEMARERGIVSESGGRDLLHAWDLICELRLDHQARQVREGERPDNFMPPAALSELQRSHLRDAFVVIRTMQSALAQGRQIG